MNSGDWGAAIRQMFADISGRYDLMNRLMTMGRDELWRRAVVDAASPPRGGRLLDIGAGTGGIALEARRRDSLLTPVAADFTLEMMHVGRRRPGGRALIWCAADALALPFSDECFDAVVSGYLLRNVSDPRQALEEQMRVLIPGGRLVCLDTSPPSGLLKPLLELFLGRCIPLLGQMVGGSRDAYTYLPDSTRAFMSPDALAGLMRRAGLRNVRYRPFMFGTVAVHVGEKPD